MNPLTRVWRSLTKQRSMPWYGSAGWSFWSGAAPSDYERKGSSVRVEGWEKHPIVNACARLIAEVGGAVPLQVCRKVGGEVDPMPRHPLQLSLDRPWPKMAGLRLRSLTLLHLAIYGNAYWRKHHEGRTLLLEPIHPEWIKYVFLDQRSLLPAKWEIQNRLGHISTVDDEDMLHFTDLNAHDWLFGFPRAASALISIVKDNEANQYVREMVTNHGLPGAAVLADEMIDEAQAKAAEDRLNSKFAGRGGRGTWTVMGGARDIKVLGFNLRELEFPDLRAISREDICASFGGIDPRMVSATSAKGAEGGLSGMQYKEARERLVLQTISPLWALIETTITDQLLPEFGADLFVRVDPEGIAEYTENMEQTATRVREDYKAGLASREEARAAVGRSPDMEATDTLLITAGSLPVPVLLAKARAETPPEPPKALPAGEAREDEPDEPPAGLSRVHVRTVPVRLFRGTRLTPDQRVDVWKSLDGLANREEGDYQREALREFHVERERIADLFAQGERQDATDARLVAIWQEIVRLYARDGILERAWQERFIPLFESTMTVSAGKTAGQVGLDFTLIAPGLRNAAQARAVRLAELVTETTARDITAIISGAREAGIGVRETAQLVDSAVFAQQAPVRSVVIARTETVGALNTADYTAAVATDVFRFKEWLDQRDGRVRDTHQQYAGLGPLDIHKEYAPGLLFPGDQRAEAAEIIQCRCTLAYYDE